jgi:hypothetical protein
MTGFLILGFIFLSCWLIMQYSMVYRFTFEQWPFFACITLTSFINIIIGMAFGVLSWLNFGKGLSSYRESLLVCATWTFVTMLPYLSVNVEYDLEKMDFEHDVFPIKESDKSTEENGDTISYPTVIFSVPTLHSDQLKEQPKGLLPSAFSTRS